MLLRNRLMLTGNFSTAYIKEKAIRVQPDSFEKIFELYQPPLFTSEIS
jgi:hypothetical protein